MSAFGRERVQVACPSFRCCLMMVCVQRCVCVLIVATVPVGCRSCSFFCTSSLPLGWRLVPTMEEHLLARWLRNAPSVSIDLFSGVATQPSVLSGVRVGRVGGIFGKRNVERVKSFEQAALVVETTGRVRKRVDVHMYSVLFVRFVVLLVQTRRNLNCLWDRPIPVTECLMNRN